MSANLHVVLTYDPLISELVAEFYDQNNIPNSALPEPFTIIATYRFFRNGVFIQEIMNGDRVALAIQRPICSDGYNVFVTYTANSVIQPASSDSIVIGSNFIYGNFISQSTIPGGVSLSLSPPVGIVPIGIQWAKNYRYMDPQPVDPLSFIATGNGIYEVMFQSLITGLTYIAATQVTQSSPAMYIKTIGNDGNIYGIFGTPQNISTLLFLPIDANSPYRNRVYVNSTLISDNSFLSLTNLVAGDLINFILTDCCDIVLTATTFILPCGIVPINNISASDNKSLGRPNNVRSASNNTVSTLNNTVSPLNNTVSAPKPTKLCGCRK